MMGRRSSPSQIKETRNLLSGLCQQNELAFWDWYTVMGGSGAIRDWHVQEMANRDFIHFTKKGYILLAHTFHRALMDSFHAAD
jgi:hypothetical protein